MSRRRKSVNNRHWASESVSNYSGLQSGCIPCQYYNMTAQPQWKYHWIWARETDSNVSHLPLPFPPEWNEDLDWSGSWGWVGKLNEWSKQDEDWEKQGKPLATRKQAAVWSVHLILPNLMIFSWEARNLVWNVIFPNIYLLETHFKISKKIL